MATIDKLALQNELKRIGSLAGATALSLEKIDGAAADFKAALESARLPTDDLEEADRSFFRIRKGESTIGFGGYELYAEDALLRSVVILPALRGRGAGSTAANLLLKRAFDDGARNAYLLTESAAPFFEKIGFRSIRRDEAPAAILATRQASSLCPSSAALLAKRLPA